MRKFAIYAIFAIGFNILFGLSGYLSFGHAAFLGVGSYTAVWSFKLLSMDIVPALIFAIVMAGIFALVIGFFSLRRTGIYFSVLTLAFAQMSDSLAYSVLTPITNGETGLLLARDDPRVIDAALRAATTGGAGLPTPALLGTTVTGYFGFYICAALLIIAFFISQKIFASLFGLALRGIKSNQTRMIYTGFNIRPYMLAAFVISGMFAGLAGGLLAITDPIAGAEPMKWTESGNIVLMTILGGVGTLIGTVIGAWAIEYFENIFSAINKNMLNPTFDFLPDGLQNVAVTVLSKFVGEGWHLTLGLLFVLFVLIVVFLPGGLVEGYQKLVGGSGAAAASRAMRNWSRGAGAAAAANRRLAENERNSPEHRPARRRCGEELWRSADAIRHRPADRGRQDPCHHRPERRGQVEASQRHHRADPADLGRGGV